MSDNSLPEVWDREKVKAELAEARQELAAAYHAVSLAEARIREIQAHCEHSTAHMFPFTGADRRRYYHCNHCGKDIPSLELRNRRQYRQNT